MVDDPALGGLAAVRPSAPALAHARPGCSTTTCSAQIEALAQPELVLPGGARLSFHPTPALVAIDVGYRHARAGKAATWR